MRCYIENIRTDSDIRSDIKTLIPDASLRRRMSRILRTGIATAMECIGGVEKIPTLDAIITATGLGCLADSEKFLRMVIANSEELLSPTPFIQSTFNTAGGQIALMRHNHCYNNTFVNGDRSFEDALLDALMLFEEKEAETILVGAFDERTDTQYEIMRRMGAYRKYPCSEGCVFTKLTGERTPDSMAVISGIYLADELPSDETCLKYSPDALLLHNDRSRYGNYPVSSSRAFAEAAASIRAGRKKVLLLNGNTNRNNTVTVIECIGSSLS